MRITIRSSAGIGSPLFLRKLEPRGATNNIANYFKSIFFLYSETSPVPSRSNNVDNSLLKSFFLKRIMALSMLIKGEVLGVKGQDLGVKG